MSGLNYINDNLELQRILLNSKMLDLFPGGFSIATEPTCERIIHNPVSAEFLRIEPWGQFSHSALEPPPVKVYQNGKLLSAAELPMQQAASYGKEIVGCELEFVWQDGVSKIARWSARPLRDENGIIYGCIAAMEDITDVVHMARELHRHKMHLEELVEEHSSSIRLSEERFAKVFHNNPQIITIFRKSDYRLIDVNNRFLSIANCSRVEAMGKTPVELGITESEFLRLKDALDKQGSLENIEISVSLDETHQVTILFSAEQIELNGEECILVASSDISELKQMQAAIARLGCLNLVGQMAAGIGHEIRNPMTVVRGYLQIMGTKPEFESHRSMFETMIGELDRANSIISEFLSLARNTPNDLRSENINVILSNLYPLLEAETFTQNKQIVFEAEETPEILLNAKEISQLVLNLFRNGLDAMQERGTLTIRTYTEDGQVVLCVQDEGIGIPLENIEKLGTPFFTTKENGTGLGLANCYSISKRHNSRIDVESNPNGTTFYVRFPCLAPKEKNTDYA